MLLWLRNMDKIFKNRRKIVKVLGNFLVVIAIIFLVKKYLGLEIDIRKYVDGRLIIRLVPTVLLFTVLISLQFIPWACILKSLTSSAMPMVLSYKVFQRANIMKYIPGNIFQYIGRGEILSEDEGLNVTIIAASLLIENGTLVTGSLLLGLCGIREYLFSFFWEYKSLFLCVLFCCAVLILILIIFRHKLLDWAKTKEIIVSKGLLGTAIMAVCFYFISLLLQALLQVYIIYQLANVFSFEMLFLVGGVFSVSWLIGYITPGASGGIGVREALFCLMLEKYVTSDIVLVSAIIFRVINIIADIIAFSVSVVIGYSAKTS